MTVQELIRELQHLPLDREVVTNQCNISPLHEELVKVDTVLPVKAGVYVGTRLIRG